MERRSRIAGAGDTVMEAAAFVKSCCRVCGRAVVHTSRRALFTSAGQRDRLAERLTEISGLTICQDDLSDFVCKKCVAGLDKFTRAQTESMKLKTQLANAMIDTTLRNRSALRWGKSGTGMRELEAGASKSRIPVYSPKQQSRPVAFTTLKRHQAETPQSAGKPPRKRTRCFHPHSPAYQPSSSTAWSLFGKDDDCEVWRYDVFIRLCHMSNASWIYAQKLAEPLPSSDDEHTTEAPVQSQEKEAKIPITVRYYLFVH